LNCNDNLFKWKLKQSPVCNYCTYIDTIEHHLYSCQVSIEFWNKFCNWLNNIYEIRIKFTECEILFGFEWYDDHVLKSINYLILIAKWFINKKKSLQEEISFIQFLCIIKDKIEILKIIFLKENKLEEFRNIYGILYNEI